MKNQTDNGFHNDLVDRTFASSAIPDPAQWVNEHHFLANFAHQLSHLQQNFSDDCLETGDNCDRAEGELAIDAKIREILKASLSDDYWQYVEGLFGHWALGIGHWALGYFCRGGAPVPALVRANREEL